MTTVLAIVRYMFARRFTMMDTIFIGCFYYVHNAAQWVGLIAIWVTWGIVTAHLESDARPPKP